MPDRRRPGLPDRRTLERVQYRRTAPALLEIESYRCAVRDVGVGGLRLEPAPAGHVWHLGERVTATLVLRTSDPITISATIGRIDHHGLALFPDGNCWPTHADLEQERATLTLRRERRAAPRLAIPSVPGRAGAASTPLRDVSATGLRYMLTANESAPAVGSRIEGALRLDSETAIEVCGRVVRHTGRDIAVAFDPPGLDPAVLALLGQRFARLSGAGRAE